MLSPAPDDTHDDGEQPNNEIHSACQFQREPQKVDEHRNAKFPATDSDKPCGHAGDKASHGRNETPACTYWCDSVDDGQALHRRVEMLRLSIPRELVGSNPEITVSVYNDASHFSNAAASRHVDRRALPAVGAGVGGSQSFIAPLSSVISAYRFVVSRLT